MALISSIGILAFYCALVYLIYHLIKKRKNPTRTLPKKKFYSALIGGFLLFTIASSFTDTSIQADLDKALESNALLTAENKKLQKDYDKVKKELDDLTTKLTDFDKAEQVLKDQQVAHQEKTEAFEKEIAALKASNTALTTEVDSLKNQVANKVTTSTASSSGDGSGSSSSAGSTQQSANVYYKNCTAVRAAGADPIYRGEPGYAKHLDRDGDGVGCE